MINVITEEKKVFGTLYTDFGTFEMLTEFPTKTNVPWFLKEQNVLQFYVIGQDGFARNIFVAGNNWLIRPHIEETTQKVKFIVEGEVDPKDTIVTISE